MNFVISLNDGAAGMVSPLARSNAVTRFDSLIVGAGHGGAQLLQACDSASSSAALG
ncbi:hypothetical protein U1738_18935 [Sphingomonas sp. GB1N7]